MDSLTFLHGGGSSSTNRPAAGEGGVSLLEVLVTMLLLAIFSGTAIANIDVLDRPLDNAAGELTSYFKQVRARAVSTTSAYFVSPLSPTRVGVATANNCADPSPAPVANTLLDLPAPVQFLDMNWTVCFNSRGVADANVVIELANDEGQSEALEVFLGGAVRRQP